MEKSARDLDQYLRGGSNRAARDDAMDVLSTPAAREYAPTVAKFLMRADPQVAAKAASALAAMQAVSYRNEIAALMSSPDYWLRLAVVESLAALGDHRCVDAGVDLLSMRQYMTDADEEKVAAVLHKLGDPSKDGPRIAAMLEPASSYTEAAVIKALGYIGAGDFRHRIAPYLAPDKPEWLQIAAIKSLAAMDARDYAPQIAAFLRDPQYMDPDTGENRWRDAYGLVRESSMIPVVIDALVRLQAGDCAPDLRRLKAMPRAGRFRVLAAEALFNLGQAPEAETVRFLGNLLNASEDGLSSAPHAALEALVRLGAAESLEYILRTLRQKRVGSDNSDSLYTLSDALYQTLDGLGFSSQCHLIAEFLHPEAPLSVRLGAVAALGHFQARDQEDVLLSLLHTGEPLDLRLQALASLCQCGTAKARAACWKIVRENKAGDLRAAALWAAICLSAGEANASTLIACLDKSEDLDVRLAAADLLKERKWPSLALPFARLLAPDENGELREVAFTILEKIGDNMDENARQAAIAGALSLLRHPAEHPEPWKSLTLLEQLSHGEELAAVFPFLSRDRNFDTRRAAVEAVKKWKSPQTVAALRPLLAVEEDDALRREAVEALASIPGPESAAALASFLSVDGPQFLVFTALRALEVSKFPEHIPAVAAMLRHPALEVRREALETLAKTGDSRAAPAILELLPSDNVWFEREVVAALGKVKAFVGTDIADRYLHAEDPELRLIAVTAVGDSGGGKYLPDLVKACDDPIDSVRVAAVRSLGAVHREASAGTPSSLRLLMNLLLHESSEVRSAAAEELLKPYVEEPAEGRSIFLESACRYPGFRQKALAAGVALMRDPARKATLQFLQSGPGSSDLKDVDRRTIIAGLQALADDARSSGFTAAGKESTGAIAQAVTAAAWEVRDASYLDHLAEEMRGFTSDLKVAEVRRAADDVRARDPVRRALRLTVWIVTGYALFWALVLLLYPLSRVAQRLLWSPFARRWLGLGWVGPLILRVPWLRDRMWQPFRESLVPLGEVVSFDEWTFFDAIRVTPADGGPEQSALQVLAPLRGVAVLRGASGLGKTTLLQALAGQARRPVALLHAGECGGGLLAALQARLPRSARHDVSFLRALVLRGSPDIFVDAVHEALPEARARLTEEISLLRGANILLTTQPVADWTAPPRAVEWQLQPLRAQDIAPFLLKQGTAAVEAARSGSLAERQRAFAARTAQFLQHFENLPPESTEALATRSMLGNPMEAVLAAELLAAGQTPDPNRLLEQRMEHLEEDYTAQVGGEFPAAAFAEHLRNWRASGAPLLRLEVFEGVASFLARHRLLRKSADVEAWRFRHDKVMEWFLRPA